MADHLALETPSAWVQRFAHLVAAGARVLDVASGSGRHARLFADRGCLVDAVDRDAACGEKLAGIVGVRFTCADIESGAWPYAGHSFDAIVVTNYLHRPLLPVLRDALSSNGVLIYETFAAGNERYGKPSNPAFLLKPGELLAAFAGLHVLAFEDGVISAPRPACIQRICVLRSADERRARLEPISESAPEGCEQKAASAVLRLGRSSATVQRPPPSIHRLLFATRSAGILR